MQPANPTGSSPVPEVGERRGASHHDGCPQHQQVGAQKLPEELPVKAGLPNMRSGAGRRGLFRLTQCHKAEAGALTPHHRAQKDAPNPAPGRGSLAGSWRRSKEVGPELGPQLGHSPEEGGAMAAVRGPAGREQHRWLEAPTVPQRNNTAAQLWAEPPDSTSSTGSCAAFPRAVLWQPQFLRGTQTGQGVAE